VRVLRTAAGRRALHVALLMGGLFALGFFCGEQAHAADGAPVVTSSTPSTPSPSTLTTASASSGSPAGLRSKTAGAVEQLVGVPADTGVHNESTEPVTSTVPPDSSSKDPAARGDDGTNGSNGANGDNTADDGASKAPRPVDGGQVALRPVTEHLVQGVDAHVVQPVGNVVQVVNDGLAGAEAKVPPLSSLPALPTLPESPSLPGLPGLEAPTFPGIPSFPGLPGRTLPLPVTGAPQPGTTASSSDDGHSDEGRSGSTGRASDALHGPRFVGGGASGDPARADGHRGVAAGYPPADQDPADGRGGAPVDRSAVDNGGTRHGDAHAVSLNHRAPLRLLPGAAARVDADGIRDRHRDIPVSPA
jgi:hypothetical protein